MMFIDEDHRGPYATPILPVEVDLRDLLAACADEAGRQAKAAALLDEALGTALATTVGRGLESDLHPVAKTDHNGAARSASTSALQQADLFRQEMAGLAKVLDLVREFTILNTKIPTDRVRACTPLRDLQHRLLAPQDLR